MACELKANSYSVLLPWKAAFEAEGGGGCDKFLANFAISGPYCGLSGRCMFSPDPVEVRSRCFGPKNMYNWVHAELA